mgnify:CR=1 FL=1
MSKAIIRTLSQTDVGIAGAHGSEPPVPKEKIDEFEGFFAFWKSKREFVEAFDVDSEMADTWSHSEAHAGKPEEYLLVWQNPMRIYSLSRSGNLLIVTVQTIYRQEEK